MSPKGYRITPNLGQGFSSGAWQTLRKFHFQKNSLVIAAQTSAPFQNPSPSEHRICAKRFHWLVGLGSRARWTLSDGAMQLAVPLLPLAWGLARWVFPLSSIPL